MDSFSNCNSLCNSDHKVELQITGSSNIEKDHAEQFRAWFLTKAYDERNNGDIGMTDELFALANGCMPTVCSHTGCVVNGVKFVVHSRDACRKTQNSGVYVPSSEGEPFYGVLQDVISLQYINGCSVVLFQCKWFDTDQRKKRLKTFQNTTSIYTNAEWYKDDPFILCTQAQQVFYTEDLVNGPAWKVAHKHSARQLWDLPDEADDTAEAHQEANSGTFELFVDLPPIEHITYRRPNSAGAVVLDDAIITLIETDDDVEEEIDDDDTVIEYDDSDQSADADDIFGDDDATTYDSDADSD